MSSRLAYASFPSLLSGPTVKLVWGVDQRAAVLPEALLRSCQSPSLDTSLKPEWINSQDGVINWEAQDGPTIERFLTWLYRGDYNAPYPQSCSPAGSPSSSKQSRGDQDSSIEGTRAGGFVDADPISAITPAHVDEPQPEAADPAPELAPELEHDILQETEQDVGQYPGEWPPEDSRAMQHVIAESFDARPLTPISSCLTVGLPEEHQTSEAGLFTQSLFPYSSHYYEEVLLAHAHIYTFAVYHHVKDLQDLALQRLTQVLTRVDCQQGHAASEIAVLVEHVYRYTLPSKYSEDAARNLVSQFAAINFDHLVHDEFETLMEEGGDFVLDVSRKVSRHLRSFSSHILSAEKRMHELESEVRALNETAQKQDELISSDRWGSISSITKKRNHR